MVNLVSEEIKLLREKAVTGLKGSTHTTAFLLCAYQAATGYFRDSLVSALVAHSAYFRSLHSLSPADKNLTWKRNLALAIDFFTMIVPNILICAFADLVLEIFIGTITLAVCFQWLAHGKIATRELWNNPKPGYEIVKYGKTVKTSLWFYRQANTLLLIATTISILFVDFPIYPRFLVKTEDYGISLMDIGTGAILLTSGITSALLEGIAYHMKNLGNNGSFRIKIWAAMKHSSIVTLIGIIRPILIKLVNYQEHVGEYGTYWNFFLTISVVTILSSLIPSPYHSRAHYIALGVMLFYEALIKLTGLQEYILASMDRVTILDKNKEGIFQCFGYTCCYLVGVSLGKMYRDSAASRKTDYEFFKRQAYYVVGFLSVFCASWYLQKTSRRLANINYVAFVAFTVSGTILLHYVGERGTSKPIYRSETIEAVSLNKLWYFLLSNIMVGIVNLSVNTLAVPPIQAVVITGLYMWVLNMIFVWIYRAGIRLALH